MRIIIIYKNYPITFVFYVVGENHLHFFSCIFQETLQLIYQILKTISTPVANPARRNSVRRQFQPDVGRFAGECGTAGLQEGCATVGVFTADPYHGRKKWLLLFP